MFLSVARGAEAFGCLPTGPSLRRAGLGPGGAPPLSPSTARPCWGTSPLLKRPALRRFRTDGQTVHVHPQPSKLSALFQFTFTLFTLCELPEGTHLIRDDSVLSLSCASPPFRSLLKAQLTLCFLSPNLSLQRAQANTDPFCFGTCASQDFPAASKRNLLSKPDYHLTFVLALNIFPV